MQRLRARKRARLSGNACSTNGQHIPEYLTCYVCFEYGEVNVTGSVADFHPVGRDMDLAREALVRMGPLLAQPALIGDQSVTFTVAGGPVEIVVPKSVLILLVRVLASFSAGEGIAVVPSHAELTTQQAADMLNVSRPHFVKLLSRGQIEYRTVGTHRRILAQSLLDYMKADDQRRCAATAELTASAQGMSHI